MELLDYLKNYKASEYSAGQIIKNQGDECTMVGFVLLGEVKISTITYQDKEEIIQIVGENDCFGDILLFLDNNKFLGDVIALKKTVIVFLNKNDLLILLENKDFLNYYLTNLSKKAFEIKQQNKLLSHKNITDRIIYDITIHSINSVFTFKNITSWARLLSIPRESLSRTLTKLENDKIIKRQQKTIYLLKNE